MSKQSHEAPADVLIATIKSFEAFVVEEKKTPSKSMVSTAYSTFRSVYTKLEKLEKNIDPQCDF